MLRAVLRGIAAVGVCAALLVGSLMTWAGSGASAQEPAHVLYGTITAYNVVNPAMPGLSDLGIEPTPAEGVLPTYLSRYRLPSEIHRHAV